MRFWIVKGSPRINNLTEMLVPGERERWVTRKPPREWAPGDGVFFWKSAPALHLLGLGRIEAVHPPDMEGESFFDLIYLTRPFEAPLTLEELRRDQIVGDASFLKAGAAGTVFPITAQHAARLLKVIQARNTRLQTFSWSRSREPAGAQEPVRALSVRQPWAELILRGEKTIEVRSIRTNIRERVGVYASLGPVGDFDSARVTRDYGLDVDGLPRGVLVGSVAIVDCRRLKISDSRASAFPLTRADTSNFAWLLESPVRASKLVKPVKHPQPVFFRPF